MMFVSFNSNTTGEAIIGMFVHMYILLDIHGQFMFAILQDYSVYSVM
jgi:hypothetical protein